ncbi:hypothetical protein LINPERPRIM_LOCUS24206 [Linum perenne]
MWRFLRGFLLGDFLYFSSKHAQYE